MAFTPSIFTKLIFNQEYLRKFSKFLEKYGNCGGSSRLLLRRNTAETYFLGNSTLYVCPVLKVMEI